MAKKEVIEKEKRYKPWKQKCAICKQFFQPEVGGSHMCPTCLAKWKKSFSERDDEE